MDVDNEKQFKKIIEMVTDIHEKNTREDRKTHSDTLNSIKTELTEIKLAIVKIEEHSKHVDEHLSNLNSKVATNVKQIGQLEKESSFNSGAVKIVSFAVIPLLTLLGSLCVWVFLDKIKYLEGLIK